MALVSVRLLHSYYRTGGQHIGVAMGYGFCHRKHRIIDKYWHFDWAEHGVVVPRGRIQKAAEIADSGIFIQHPRVIPVVRGVFRLLVGVLIIGTMDNSYIASNPRTLLMADLLAS